MDKIKPFEDLKDKGVSDEEIGSILDAIRQDPAFENPMELARPGAEKEPGFAEAVEEFYPIVKPMIPGNIDTEKRVVKDNKDGTISTLRSMSFQPEKGGLEVLIPKMSPEGVELTEEDAIKRFYETGEHLGAFNSPEEATKFAKELSKQQEKLYGKKKFKGGDALGTFEFEGTPAEFEQFLEARNKEAWDKQTETGQQLKKEAGKPLYPEAKVTPEGVEIPERELPGYAEYTDETIKYLNERIGLLAEQRVFDAMKEMGIEPDAVMLAKDNPQQPLMSPSPGRFRDIVPVLDSLHQFADADGLRQDRLYAVDKLHPYDRIATSDNELQRLKQKRLTYAQREEQTAEQLKKQQKYVKRLNNYFPGWNLSPETKKIMQENFKQWDYDPEKLRENINKTIMSLKLDRSGAGRYLATFGNSVTNAITSIYNFATIPEIQSMLYGWIDPGIDERGKEHTKYTDPDNPIKNFLLTMSNALDMASRGSIDKYTPMGKPEPTYGDIYKRTVETGNVQGFLDYTTRGLIKLSPTLMEFALSPFIGASMFGIEGTGSMYQQLYKPEVTEESRAVASLLYGAVNYAIGKGAFQNIMKGMRVKGYPETVIKDEMVKVTYNALKKSIPQNYLRSIANLNLFNASRITTDYMLREFAGANPEWDRFLTEFMEGALASTTTGIALGTMQSVKDVGRTAFWDGMVRYCHRTAQKYENYAEGLKSLRGDKLKYDIDNANYITNLANTLLKNVRTLSAVKPGSGSINEITKAIVELRYTLNELQTLKKDYGNIIYKHELEQVGAKLYPGYELNALRIYNALLLDNAIRMYRDAVVKSNQAQSTNLLEDLPGGAGGQRLLPFLEEPPKPAWKSAKPEPVIPNLPGVITDLPVREEQTPKPVREAPKLTAIQSNNQDEVISGLYGELSKIMYDGHDVAPANKNLQISVVERPEDENDSSKGNFIDFTFKRIATGSPDIEFQETATDNALVHWGELKQLFEVDNEQTRRSSGLDIDNIPDSEPVYIENILIPDGNVPPNLSGLMIGVIGDKKIVLFIPNRLATKEVTDDTEGKGGLPGQEPKGEEPEPSPEDQETSPEAPGTGGILQEPEKALNYKGIIESDTEASPSDLTYYKIGDRNVFVYRNAENLARITNDVPQMIPDADGEYFPIIEKIGEDIDAIQGRLDKYGITLRKVNVNPETGDIITEPEPKAQEPKVEEPEPKAQEPKGEEPKQKLPKQTDKYYNSHGIKVTWEEIQEVEVGERENYTAEQFDEWKAKYNITDQDKVIWVTDERTAYTYVAPAGDRDLVLNASLETLRERYAGQLRSYTTDEGFIIPESDDGDDGYLFVFRKSEKKPNQTEVVSSDSKHRIPLQYGFVNLDNLVFSNVVTPNSDKYPINDKYPPELQPRDRSTDLSRLDVETRAKALDPTQLEFDIHTTGGSPIAQRIDGKVVVLAGNGRTMSIAKAYYDVPERAEEYKQYLIDNAEKWGLTPGQAKLLKKPVLVRFHTTDEVSAQFIADDSNKQTTMAYSPLEVARQDAKNLSSGIFYNINITADGDIVNVGNLDFIRQFVNETIPQQEHNTYISKNVPTNQLISRIQKALIIKAFGDNAISQRIIEIMDIPKPEAKNIVTSMIDIAPVVTRTKALIDDELLFPLDISKELANAVDVYLDFVNQDLDAEAYLKDLEDSLFVSKKINEFEIEMFKFLYNTRRSKNKLFGTLLEHYLLIPEYGNPSETFIDGIDYRMRTTPRALFRLVRDNYGKEQTDITEILRRADDEQREKGDTEEPLQPKGMGGAPKETEPVKEAEPVKESAKRISEEPLEFQDNNQEVIVHEDWGDASSVRYDLEGAGDIFREFAKFWNADYKYADGMYIDEKARRIKRLIDGVKKGDIHPTDTMDKAYEVVPDKIDKLKELWKRQPIETKGQQLARDMNLALLDMKWDEVLDLLDKIDKQVDNPAEPVEEPAVKEHKISEYLKRYKDAKNKSTDTSRIILVRHGDFYETYNEDAKKIAQILNITLTTRNKGGEEETLIAGFPYHALDNYLDKLIKAGQKVVISEEIKAPSPKVSKIKSLYNATFGLGGSPYASMEIPELLAEITNMAKGFIEQGSIKLDEFVKTFHNEISANMDEPDDFTRDYALTTYNTLLSVMQSENPAIYENMTPRAEVIAKSKNQVYVNQLLGVKTDDESRAVYGDGEREDTAVKEGISSPESVEGRGGMAVSEEQAGTRRSDTAPTDLSKTPEPEPTAVSSSASATDEHKGLGEHRTAEVSGKTVPGTRANPLLSGYNGRNADLRDLPDTVLTRAQRIKANEKALAIIETVKDPGELTAEMLQSLAKYTGKGGLQQGYGKLSERSQYFTPGSCCKAMTELLDNLAPNLKKWMDGAGGIGNMAMSQPDKKWTLVEIDKIPHDIAKLLLPQAKLYNIPYEHYHGEKQDIICTNAPFDEKRIDKSEYPEIPTLHGYFLVKNLDDLRSGGLLAFMVTSGLMDAKDTTARQMAIARGNILACYRLPETFFSKTANTSVTVDIIFMQKRPPSQNEEYGIPEHVQMDNNAFVNVYTEDTVKDGKTYELKINDYYQKHPENILGNLEVGVDKMYSGEPKYVVTSDKDYKDTVNRLSKVNLTGSFVPKYLEFKDNNIGTVQVNEIDYEGFMALVENNAIKHQFNMIETKPEIWIANNEFSRDMFIDANDVYVVDKIYNISDIRNRKAKTYRLLDPQYGDKIKLLDKILKDSDNYQETHAEHYKNMGTFAIKQYKEKFGIHPLKDPMLVSLFNGKLVNEQFMFLTRYGNLFDENWKPGKILTEITKWKSGTFELNADDPIEIRARANENFSATIELDKAKYLNDDDAIELVMSGKYGIINKNEIQNAIFYYSGNIYDKIDATNEMLDDDEYVKYKPALNKQIGYLEETLPEPYTIDKITVLGNESWYINNEKIRMFKKQKFEDPIETAVFPLSQQPKRKSREDQGVAEYHYVPVYKFKEALRFFDSSKFYGRGGLPARHVKDIAVKTYYNYLNGKTLVRQAKDESMERYIERVEVHEEMVREMQDAIRKAIADNEEWKEYVVRTYNRLYNAEVEVNWMKGSYIAQDIIDIVKNNANIVMSEHQVSWMIQAFHIGVGINGQPMGAGKTYSGLGLTRLSRDRGLSKKPVHIAEGKNIKKYEREARNVFGADAKIKVVHQLPRANRDKILHDIATNNYDLVIMTPTAFASIPLSKEMVQDYLEDLREELQAEANMLLNQPIIPGEDPDKVRQRIAIQTAIDTIVSDVEEVLQNARYSYTFDQLGFDFSLADESHAYKTIEFASTITQMGLLGAPLGSTGDLASETGERRVRFPGSYMATHYRICCDHITKNNNGRNVFQMTGTPTPNKIMEFYTLIRHLGKDIWKQYGIESARDFVETFVITGIQQIEQYNRVTGKLEPGHKQAIVGLKNMQALQKIRKKYMDYRKLENMQFTQNVPQTELIVKTIRIPRMVAKVFNEIQDAVDLAIKQDPKSGARLSQLTHERRLSVDPRLAIPTEFSPFGFKIIPYRTGNPATDKIQTFLETVVEIMDWEKANNLPISVQLAEVDFIGDERYVGTTTQETEGTDTEQKLDQETTMMASAMYKKVPGANERPLTFLPGEVKAELMRMTGLSNKEIVLVYGDFITDIDTGKEKKFNGQRANEMKFRIQEAVNLGKVKVAIGHIKSMGQGMDLNRLTSTVHIVTESWTPGEGEQFTARAKRQGNIHSKIRVIRYCEAGTRDEYMLRTNQFKQGWQQALYTDTKEDYVDVNMEGSDILPTRELVRLVTQPDPAERWRIRKSIQYDELMRLHKRRERDWLTNANRLQKARTNLSEARNTVERIETYDLPALTRNIDTTEETIKGIKSDLADSKKKGLQKWEITSLESRLKTQEDNLKEFKAKLSLVKQQKSRLHSQISHLEGAMPKYEVDEMRSKERYEAVANNVRDFRTRYMERVRVTEGGQETILESYTPRKTPTETEIQEEIDQYPELVRLQSIDARIYQLDLPGKLLIKFEEDQVLDKVSLLGIDFFTAETGGKKYFISLNHPHEFDEINEGFTDEMALYKNLDVIVSKFSEAQSFNSAVELYNAYIKKLNQTDLSDMVFYQYVRPETFREMLQDAVRNLEQAEQNEFTAKLLGKIKPILKLTDSVIQEAYINPEKNNYDDLNVLKCPIDDVAYEYFDDGTKNSGMLELTVDQPGQQGASPTNAEKLKLYDNQIKENNWQMQYFLLKPGQEVKNYPSSYSVLEQYGLADEPLYMYDDDTKAPYPGDMGLTPRDVVENNAIDEYANLEVYCQEMRLRAFNVLSDNNIRPDVIIYANEPDNPLTALYFIRDARRSLDKVTDDYRTHLAETLQHSGKNDGYPTGYNSGYASIGLYNDEVPYGEKEGKSADDLVDEFDDPEEPEAGAVIQDSNTIDPKSLMQVHLPELVDLCRQILGYAPSTSKKLKRRNILGSFRPKDYGTLDGAMIVLSDNLRDEQFKAPQQLENTLNHEIGHLTDWIPEMDLRKGDLLGHLYIIKEEMIAEMIEGGMTEQEIKELMKRRRNLLARLKRNKLNNNKKGDRQKILDELEEISEHFITDKDLRDELKALSYSRRPLGKGANNPKYMKYRNSALELYADFISALLNSPETAEQFAPKFFKLFFKTIEKKPAFVKAMNGIYDWMAKDLFGRRERMILEMHARGEDTMKAIRKRQRFHLRSIPIMLKDNFVSKGAELQRWEDELNLQYKDRPTNLIHAHAFIGQRLKWIFNNVHKIRTGLHNNDITDEVFDEYLLMKRALSRYVEKTDAEGNVYKSEIYSPGGFGWKEATAQLEWMKDKYGEYKYSLMEIAEQKVMDWFHTAIMEDAVDLYGQKLVEKWRLNYEENDEFYAPMLVAKYYVSEHLSPKMIELVGTMSDTLPTLTSLLMKSMAIAMASDNNKIRKTMANNVIMKLPVDVYWKPAKITKLKLADGSLRYVYPPEYDKETGLKLLVWKENGKPKVIYADSYILDAIDNTPNSLNEVSWRVLGRISDVFRAEFTQYRPAFQITNVVRDFQRSYSALYGMGTIANPFQLIKLYLENLPRSYKRVAEIEEDKWIIDAEMHGALLNTWGDVFRKYDIDSENQYEAMMKQLKIMENDYRGAIKVLSGFAKRVRFIGDIAETLPKLSAYKYLVENFLGRTDIPYMQNRDTIAEFVRTYVSTPNYMDGGKLSPTTNRLWLFSNMMIQSYRTNLRFLRAKFVADDKTRAKIRLRFLWSKMVMGMAWRLATLLFKYGIPLELAHLLLGIDPNDSSDKLRRMLSRIPDYEYDNYLIFPLWEEGGKTVYGRLALEEDMRFVGAFINRVAGVVFGSRVGLQSLSSLFDYTAGQFPGLNPALVINKGWIAFGQGDNPVDEFTGHKIMTDDEHTAGGGYALNKMAKWSLSKLGLPVSYIPVTARTKTEKVTESALGRWSGLRRLIRVTDRGLYDDVKYDKELNEEKRMDARKRVVQRQFLQEYVNKYLDETGGGKQIVLSVAKNNLALMIHALASDKNWLERNMDTTLNEMEKLYMQEIVSKSNNPYIQAVRNARTNQEKAIIINKARSKMSDSEFYDLIYILDNYKFISEDAQIKAIKLMKKKKPAGR